jgi:hypothetical protein
LLFLAGPAQQILLPAISAAGNIREIQSQIDRVGNEVEQQVSAAHSRLEQLRSRSLNEIADRLREIDVESQKLSAEPKLQSNSYLDLARLFAEGNLEKSLRNALRKDVLQEEERLLQRLQTYVRSLSDRKSQEGRLKMLGREWYEAKQAEINAEKKYRELERQALCRVPLTACSKAKDQALDEWKNASRRAWHAHDEWKVQNSVLNGTASIATAPAFQINSAIMRSSLDDMARQLARVESWGISTATPALGALWTACKIVGAALAVSLGLKAAFYFLLAPLAQRRPGMVVRPGARIYPVKDFPLSSISLPISISQSEELVVVGSHLQSLTDGHKTSTKWLFSTAHPFSSFFSGLWMMTRVQASYSCTAVLSATTDPLEELNSHRLEAGEGLVILPKHLLAVVYPRSAGVRMRSHWKFDIHAWLTLQFRYLVLEGPCQVIFGGCRGVRIESAGNARAVSQAMIVGFSSHLEYSVIRTETFMAYLFGQRPLFNDRLMGPGVVLYQEVPSTAQRSGVTGRGLQGVMDGAMRAFGL